MKTINKISTLIALAALIISANLNAAPVGTGFNYQGELIENGVAVNTPRVFTFSLFDAETGGTQIGFKITVGATPFTEFGLPVNNGLFNVPNLDFGDQYTGDELWLEITVKKLKTALCGIGANPPCPVAELLTPRQRIHAVPYAVQSEFGSPWTESGTTVSYNGSAELTGTASVDGSNGGLSVGNTGGSHMTIDGDDIQRRTNGSNDPGTMYLNFYGGDVRIASSSNKAVIVGDLKQPIDQNGVMKYMASVNNCGTGSTMGRQYNGVNSGVITVVAAGVGRCIIKFPTGMHNRFWQASINPAPNGAPPSTIVSCRIASPAIDEILCSIADIGDGTFTNSSIMILVY